MVFCDGKSTNKKEDYASAWDEEQGLLTVSYDF
jgi:hypothetical protein